MFEIQQEVKEKYNVDISLHLIKIVLEDFKSTIHKCMGKIVDIEIPYLGKMIYIFNEEDRKLIRKYRKEKEVEKLKALYPTLKKDINVRSKKGLTVEEFNKL